VSEYIHKAVLVAEVLEALRPVSGRRYVDGTVGGAGHAAALLAASAPTGWLYGCDRDVVAIEAARVRLAEFAGRFELRQGNFADLAAWVPPNSCDGVLLDLGVSSYQLDTPARGFSFQQDGPLDMRMDQSETRTAADVVNSAPQEELTRLFRELGGERHARRIAGAIVRARPLRTTLELANLVARVAPRGGGRLHPATRVFLALRLAVNDELGSLQRGLAAALAILRPGGRLAVITFHSVEDRLVKDFGRTHTRGYTFPGGEDVPELRQPCAPVLRWVTRAAVRPGSAERAANPRSRSARLRVLEKL